MIGNNGLELIKHFESCRLDAFKPIPSDPWTIGWGRTRGVRNGDSCSREQADAWLIEDVQTAEADVDTLITLPLTTNQRDALVSFAYNLGGPSLQMSTLRKLLNAGDVSGAAEQFTRWNKSKGQVLAGLTRRREAERKLFLTPDNEKFMI